MEQVQTILDYVSKSSIPEVIKGANDEKDALKKFKERKENFMRPVVCLPFSPVLFDGCANCMTYQVES